MPNIIWWNDGKPALEKNYFPHVHISVIMNISPGAMGLFDFSADKKGKTRLSSCASLQDGVACSSALLQLLGQQACRRLPAHRFTEKLFCWNWRLWHLSGKQTQPTTHNVQQRLAQRRRSHVTLSCTVGCRNSTQISCMWIYSLTRWLVSSSDYTISDTDDIPTRQTLGARNKNCHLTMSRQKDEHVRMFFAFSRRVQQKYLGMFSDVDQWEQSVIFDCKHDEAKVVGG